MASGVDMLVGRFPVVRQIVGEDIFRPMARLFVYEHAAGDVASAVHGDAFADFVAAFPAVVELRYLADVARLEAAIGEARDVPEGPASSAPAGLPPDPGSLAAVGLQGIAGARLTLHPSVRVIASAYPVVTIWQASRSHHAAEDSPQWEAEEALVVRAGRDVAVHRMAAGGRVFVAALRADGTLAEARAAAARVAPLFDLGAHLATLFASGAVVAIRPGDAGPHD